MDRALRQIRTALRMVARRPLRSSLAAAGVAIAMAVLLVAVGVAERGRRSAMEEIRRMGADVIVADAVASRNVGGRARTGATVMTLTEADAREMAVRISDVAVVAAEYRGTLPAKVENLARQVTVGGVQPSYAALREASVATGRFFTDVEENAAMRVAVLGARVARDLFGPDPVGERFRLNGAPFTVIGVLPERGTGFDAFSEDEVVFVPLKTARRRLFQVEYVHRIFVRAKPGADLQQLGLAVSALLASRHSRVAGESVDFRVQDQRRLVDMRRAAAVRLRAFEWAVALVMLLAGAGGVFALQVLSVRERRAEVGVRRALGATRRDVFAQFVAEASAIAAAGTVLGMAVGLASVRLTDAHVASALAGIVSLVLLATCMLAGALPASHAARLPSGQALRLL